MNRYSPFLFLSEADMAAVGVGDAARSVDVADEVFRLLHDGDYVMGGLDHNSHGLVLVFPETSPFPNMPLAGPDRRFSAMPAYLGGRFDLCGVKWYGSNAANRSRNLPRSILTVMLNDRETGEPLALLSAKELSSARTAAVPAVASRYLPQTSPTKLAVIGCGEINRAATRAILSQNPSVTHVACYNRSREKAEEFAAWVSTDLGVSSSAVDSARSCVADAELVTVAASRTAALEMKADWFAPDACILLSGPMLADDDLWTGSRIVWDHVPLHESYVADARASEDVHRAFAAQIGGPLYELIDAKRVPSLAESEDLGTVIAEGRPPRRGRTVFISSGMAVFDVAWAADLLERAREQGVGTPLELWGSSAANPAQKTSDSVASPEGALGNARRSEVGVR